MAKTTHSSGIVWDEALGMGYYPVAARGQYGEAYWQNYQGLKTTQTGVRLTDQRLALVRGHCPAGDILVDIGIGSGQFIEAYGPGGYGYDVNPRAVKWLCERNMWWDPQHSVMPSASFWDSLEHAARPSELLNKVQRFAFISIPIFSGLGHLLKSKHFKKDEHFWYFTEKGLAGWMSRHGFQLVTSSRMEEECGREDVGTFVFARIAPAPEESW